MGFGYRARSGAFAGDGQGAVTAFWLVIWAEMRGRWRAMASLALLLGLVGGVVLGAAAGARRLLTAVLIALWPGWRAARLRPAAVLRTE